MTRERAWKIFNQLCELGLITPAGHTGHGARTLLDALSTAGAFEPEPIATSPEGMTTVYAVRTPAEPTITKTQARALYDKGHGDAWTPFEAAWAQVTDAKAQA